MNFDLQSLKKIAGDSTEIFMYGFSGGCYYDNFTTTLGPNNFKFFDFGQFEHANTFLKDSSFNAYDGKPTNREIHQACKNTLTNILFENYLRHKEGKPLILVIFICEYKDNKQSHFFDTQRLAKTHAIDLGSSVSESELRRIYKSVVETPQHISEIAQKTYKLVRWVNEINNSYLIEMPPLWHDQNFIEAWKARNRQPCTKIAPWKDYLTKNTEAYNSRLFSRNKFERTDKETNTISVQNPISANSQ